MHSMGSKKMADITKVIKVKYEDEMRRITAKYENGRPDISFVELRSKIFNLFQLNGDAHLLKLRYMDEDGDVIGMANEDDLVDAFKQELCPFHVEASLTRKNMTEVHYATGNGTIFPAARHGGAGDAVNTIFKYPNEKLQKISGYCGLVENTWTVIKGLSFETNCAKYGPFGVMDWAPFEFDLRSRDVVGFYGRSCCRYLGSIGLHTQT